MFHLARRFFLLALLLAAVASFVGCDKQKSADQEAIRKLWDEWHRVNTQRDGVAAINVYSSDTFDYYARVVKLAMDAKQEEIFKEDFVTIREILRMRCRATRKQLQRLDGRAYTAFATSQGWYASDGDPMVLKDIRIAGDFATAVMYDPEALKEYRADQLSSALSRRRSRRNRAEKPPEYPVGFVREGGFWKLDEKTLYPTWNEWFAEERKFAGINMRDFLMEIEREETGNPVPMSVWNPMKK